MELDLSRVDYTVVGLTHPNCMKLLPSSAPKHQQKVAVADHDGVLQVFSIKKEDIQQQFKTLPGSEITAVRCGGAAGTAYDKIFVSSGNEIKGFTKKGKLFLSFDTNMTEPITSMYVYESDLILCGKHVYNHYRDCKDVGSYLCGDSILDVVAVTTDKNRRLTSVIACEGRMLRILEHSRVIHSIDIGSSPVILNVFKSDDNINHILFGTIDGKIGILEMDKMQISYRWLLNNENGSSISCIDTYDMTGDGSPNLLIGRQDGSIEVYSFAINDSAEPPLLIYSHKCGESVTSIQGGIVGSQGYDEILVSTYTGRIFGLTTEIIQKNVEGDCVAGGYVYSPETNHKIVKLKAEISDLENKIMKEREKYQLTTQALSLGVSAIPILPLKDSMILNKNEASYTLIIEVPTAIDNILLQSNVPIDLLDVEKNSAVISYSECDLQSGNYLLVAYRCQINTNRIEIKIRTIEGQYGTLQAYVTPMVQPKCCQLRQYDIKPLSLHMRCNTFDDKRPYNTLTLKGNYSLAEMHTWISKCFLEVPDKPITGEKSVLIFHSVFTETIVQCSYGKGEADFKSDNISTISILKEYLTKEATKKKIKLEISTSVNDESVPHVLYLLDPKLQDYIDIAKKLTILEAIHELEINEDENINYLTPKYRKILAEEKQYANYNDAKPSYLDRLCGIITDLYIDYNKFKGTISKNKIPELLGILEDYDCEKLLSFFQPINVE